MKRTSFILLMVLLLVSCSGDKKFKFGITPTGLPITLNINSSGKPTIDISGNIKLPFLTLSISTDDYIQPYCTYVELFCRKDNKKYVFELARDNTEFKSVSKGLTEVTVLKKRYSTVVVIDSDEISKYLYKGTEPDAKPSFPEHPWRYFAITKTFCSNVDWEINSFGDFFADILFGIIWILTVMLDLIVMLASFLIRLIIWIFILLAYVVGLY